MTRSTTKAHPRDAISLLTYDHREVKNAFKEFMALGDRAFVARKKLADEICAQLSLHATLEEEIFYPAVREGMKDGAALVDEASVEHFSAKELISRIVAMAPEDDLYYATVKVLFDQVEHHVEEEEGKMFAKVRKSDMDLVALGEEMIERREQLFTIGSATWPYTSNLVNLPLPQVQR
ncbi:hemerythrin domain-containing protein [soil metagenome]